MKNNVKHQGSITSVGQMYARPAGALHARTLVQRATVRAGVAAVILECDPLLELPGGIRLPLSLQGALAVRAARRRAGAGTGTGARGRERGRGHRGGRGSDVRRRRGDVGRGGRVGRGRRDVSRGGGDVRRGRGHGGRAGADAARVDGGRVGTERNQEVNVVFLAGNLNLRLVRVVNAWGQLAAAQLAPV